MASARKGDTAMTAIGTNLRSAVTFTTMILFLALFGAVMRPDRNQTKPQKPPRDPMTLVASPNDPQMIESIQIAQATARVQSGGNAWTKPKADGPTATFATPGGSITLSRNVIAQANSIYPRLVSRAKHPHEAGTMRRSADAGFDAEFSDRSEWGN